jgi:hypothetical protein
VTKEVTNSSQSERFTRGIQESKTFPKDARDNTADSPFVRNPTSQTTVSKKNKILPIYKGESDTSAPSILNMLPMQQINSGAVNYSKFNRPFDKTEINSKRLGEIRDLFEELMNEFIYLYDHSSNSEDQVFFMNLEARYVRHSSITATMADPEPWNSKSSITDQIKESYNSSKLTHNQLNQGYSLAKVVVEKTGLTSK